jgi:hypothetical protein
MIATIGKVSFDFQALFGTPERTVRDQRARLSVDPTIMQPSIRGRTQPPLAAHEAINLLIAVAAPAGGTRRPLSTLEIVRLCRAAQRLADEQCRPEKFAGLSIGHASTFGEAVDALVHDMRSGVFRKWCGPDGGRSWLKFFNGGSRLVLGVERYPNGPLGESAALMFRNDAHPGDRETPFLESCNTVDGFVLERLAEMLGPAEPAMAA